MDTEKARSKYKLLIDGLSEKLDRIPRSEVRFYNIERIPLVLKHTLTHSDSCDQCKLNIPRIEKLIGELPESLENFESRKVFDDEKNSITAHLEKQHKVRLVNYHYSVFTLIGLISGSAIGFVFQIFYQQRIWLIFAMLGVMIGAVYGKIQEKKFQNEKRLM